MLHNKQVRLIAAYSTVHVFVGGRRSVRLYVSVRQGRRRCACSRMRMRHDAPRAPCSSPPILWPTLVEGDPAAPWRPAASATR